MNAPPADAFAIRRQRRGRASCAARHPSASSRKCRRYLRKSSAYAERGTALHAAMALLIERERSLDSLVGETFNGYTITRDDVENALRPALAYVEALLDAPGAEYYLEHRVVFPTIAGAFGTADLIVRIGSTVHVVDFKFGAGVRVLALYPGRRRGHHQRAARCSMPRRRATRCPNFLPASKTSF